MPGINDQYNAKQLQIISALTKKIRKIYEASIVNISFTAASVSPKTERFNLSVFPLLEKKIDEQLKKMNKEIYSAVTSGINQGWANGNKKTDAFVDKRLAGKRPTKKGKQILYDPNKEALNAFLNRKDKGLKLSDRVWNLTKKYKNELEQAIGIGISEGKSATKIASELKQYLNDPDKLFKRVKDEDGKLKLSAKARNYHPGQGVYRSSYQNALRVARTETNIAYRSADFERWKTLPFIVGTEVRLSKNHPRYDICDQLVGKYPKDFKFTGWHPQCLCHQVPVMMSDAEYDQLEDQILRGDPINVQSEGEVLATPKGFQKWIFDNKERVKNWASKPYWYTDNQQYIKSTGKNPLKKVVKKTESVDYSKLNIDHYIKAVRLSPYKDQLTQLTDEMKASIYGYTGSEYFRLNNFLRGQNVSFSVSDELTNYRNLLNNALDEISERFEGTVYRGTRLSEKALEVYRDAIKNNAAVFHNYFTSTSYDASRKFSGNTHFIIYSKNGRKIEKMSQFDNEKEVLFKAGTRFKVEKYSKKDNEYYITLREI